MNVVSAIMPILSEGRSPIVRAQRDALESEQYSDTKQDGRQPDDGEDHELESPGPGIRIGVRRPGQVCDRAEVEPDRGRTHDKHNLSYGQNPERRQSNDLAHES